MSSLTVADHHATVHAILIRDGAFILQGTFVARHKIKAGKYLAEVRGDDGKPLDYQIRYAEVSPAYKGDIVELTVTIEDIGQ